MTPGETQSFYADVNNAGDTMWYNGNYFKFVKTGGAPIISPTYGHLPAVINPGDTPRWSFSLTAPAAEGSYPFAMQMVHTAGALYMKPDGTTCAAPVADSYFGGVWASTIVVSSGPTPTPVPTPTPTPILPLSCSPTTQNAQTNVDATITATGGNGTFSWSGGGTPATGSGSSFTTRYAASGTNNVIVTSASQTATCQVITSNPPLGSNIGLVLPSTNDYCFGGGAFVQLTWTYSGENPQASYDMQIVESGQAFSDINNVVENPNALVPSSLGGDRYASRVVNITTDPEYSYNKTYKARVRLRWYHHQLHGVRQ